MKTWVDNAHRDGWKPDQECACAAPQPGIVGGNGYVIPPLMCLNCRKKAAA
jgi:hypothetical protein